MAETNWCVNDGDVNVKVAGEFLPHVFDDKVASDFIRQISGADDPYHAYSEQPNHSCVDSKSLGVTGGTEWWQSLLVILASLIGVGVLSLPEAIATLGWVPGLVALVLCGIASLWSGYMYTHLVLAVPHAQVMPDVGEAAYGRPGRIATMAMGYAYIAGVGIVYHLTASQALQQVFAGVPHLECQPTTGFIFAILMILPLQAQSMHAVSCLSALGTLMILVALAIVGAKLVAAGRFPGARTVLMEPFSTQHWAAGVTCCVFAFAGQAIFVELISRQRVFASFRRTINYSSSIALIVYVACSSIGYTYVGRDITGPITSALPVDMWTRLLNACLFIHVAMSYVIDMNVLTDAMLRLFWPSAWQTSCSEHSQPSQQGESVILPARKFPWFIVSSVLVMIAYMLESSIPFFSQLVSLTGALLATQIMLSLPAFFALRVFPAHQLTRSMRWQCFVAIVLAMLLSLCGAYGAIQDIIAALEDKNKPAPWACAAPKN